MENLSVLIRLASVLATALGLFAASYAQTTTNPDLSVVGNSSIFSHNDSTRTSEKEKLNVADPEIEIMVSGYLNPYARADAVVAWHAGASAEVEEVYATVLRGLPLNTNLRVGKYLLEFGRLNPVHEHAWSFVQRPIPHVQFFGDEGLNDVAVRASFSIPTGGAFTEVMAALLKGDALLGHSHEAEEEHVEDESVSSTSPGVFGRVTSSFATSEHAELAVGASAVYGVYGAHHHDEEEETEGQEELEHSVSNPKAVVVGVDVKYKCKPNRYASLQVEAEGLVRREEQHDGDHLNSFGGYGYIDYRFRQKYNAGMIGEYVRRRSLIEAEEGVHSIAESDTWRVGVFAGFAPMEETSLVRLVTHWTKPEEGDGFWELMLQMVFSLGPHQPHNF
jgi:hypothetical protein